MLEPYLDDVLKVALEPCDRVLLRRLVRLDLGGGLLVLLNLLLQGAYLRVEVSTVT